MRRGAELAPLEIQGEQSTPLRARSSWRLALFLAGAYWELTRNHRSADPRKLEIPL